MKFPKISILFSLLLLSVIGCKNVDVQQVASALEQYQQATNNNGLSRETLVAGLKEALEVGTGNSVAKTSVNGGFSNDAMIKILVPEPMAKLASNMRKYGFGSYVDRFELQMNRSAEMASAEAKHLFIDSISQMSIQDAWSILNGPDNAATQYFRQTTEVKLKSRFKPVIAESMSKVGFYSDYRKLLSTYQSLPISDKPNLDIENYILQRTLDGLFIKVAEEEAKIRNNPAARVTELLRRVFSKG